MDNLGKKVIDSGLWVSLLRVVQKILSVARIIVLARLLFPEDFGLFGIATIILTGFEVLTRTGFDDALIYKRGIIEEYLHTAFWIQVSRGLILGGLIYLSAPFVSTFFDDERIIAIVQALALVHVFAGFRSIGIVLLRRELSFRKFSLFLLVSSIIEFLIIISCVFIYRNVWALVVGTIAGEGIRTLLSYVFHSYRPKFFFDVHKAVEMYRFGVWLFLSGIVSYIALQFDSIFVGKMIGVEMLGIYKMAFLIANVPTTEFIKTFGQVLTPAYAAIQHDAARLSKSLTKSISVVSAIIVPISITIIITADIIVPFFLGGTWINIIPFLIILSIAGVFRALGGSMVSFFIGTGNTKFIFNIELIRAISLVASVYILYGIMGGVGVAWGVLFSTICMFTVIMFGIRKNVVLNMELFYNNVPTVISSILLTIALIFLKPNISSNVLGITTILVVIPTLYITVALIIETKLRISIFHNFFYLLKKTV